MSTALLGCAVPGTSPSAAGAPPRRKLVLAAAEELFESAHGAWARKIYAEALHRLGYELELRSYPARRTSMMTDTGRVDGEINRAARYGQLHRHLVRIEPAHFSLTFAAYARPGVHLRAGWEGLRHRGYRVDYRSGVAICELELPAVVPPDRLSSSSRTVLGLRKLVHGRSDVLVDLDTVVEPLLRGREFAHAGIRQVAVMEKVEMHAYLHERHRALAARLSAVLAQMKRDGTVARLHRAAHG